MNVERKKRGVTESHCTREKNLQTLTSVDKSKKPTSPSTTEQQIAEIERTFSDTWEW
jgi:hypothetical protein